jgi:hypothetical protein
MDFEKIRTDFKKRYGNSCENIYFAGKKIEMFARDGLSVSACLTVGEAMATAKRGDGKITMQFSGTDDMVSFNVAELYENRKNEMAKLLIKAKSLGMTPLGADIFFFNNTRLTHLFEPLVIGGLSAFVKNVPPKGRLLPLFEDFAENVKILSGRKGCFTLFDGQKVSYASFFGGKYKVVLSCDESVSPPEISFESTYAQEGILAIKKGDAKTFGTLLDKDAQIFLEACKESKTHGIYSSALGSKDALGSGIMEDGNVFSFVENEKIDSFIRNTSSGYEKYFGGNLEFYVTDFADSGFFLKEC